MAIFLKKNENFWQFFFERMSSFWQFFDSQMAIFRRVSFGLPSVSVWRPGISLISYINPRTRKMIDSQLSRFNGFILLSVYSWISGMTSYDKWFGDVIVDNSDGTDMLPEKLLKGVQKKQNEWPWVMDITKLVHTWNSQWHEIDWFLMLRISYKTS